MKTFITEKIYTEFSNNTVFQEIEKAWNKNSAHNETGIQFSFEKENHTAKNFLQELSDTNGGCYLIIIGYSFPVYNRIVDKVVLNSLFERRLQKIYIQDPNADEIKRKIIGFFEHPDHKVQISEMCEPVQAYFESSIERINQPFHIPMEFEPIYFPDEVPPVTDVVSYIA